MTIEQKYRPRCFFDVEVGGKPVGRVVFELFADKCPATCENFRALCTGEKGIGKTTEKPLHYKGTIFHRIVKNFMIQGGDFSANNGTGGESIYGGTFKDENFETKHDKPFLLSMANRGKDTNGSQFFITTQPSPHLDGVHVVFGHVISGESIVSEIETQKTDQNSRPTTEVRIGNCGELVLKVKPKDKKKKKTHEGHASDASEAGGDHSSDEKNQKRKKKKHKKHSKKHKKEKKHAKREQSQERDRREYDPECSIRADEIPEIPTNNFLMRRSPPTTPADNRNPYRPETFTYQRRPKVSKSGRKIKGRGFMRYRTPSPSGSRSGSDTPPHWKQAQARMRPLRDIEQEQRELDDQDNNQSRSPTPVITSEAHKGESGSKKEHQSRKSAEHNGEADKHDQHSDAKNKSKKSRDPLDRHAKSTSPAREGKQSMLPEKQDTPLKERKSSRSSDRRRSKSERSPTRSKEEQQRKGDSSAEKHASNADKKHKDSTSRRHSSSRRSRDRDAATSDKGERRSRRTEHEHLSRSKEQIGSKRRRRYSSSSSESDNEPHKKQELPILSSSIISRSQKDKSPKHRSSKEQSHEQAVHSVEIPTESSLQHLADKPPVVDETVPNEEPASKLSAPYEKTVIPFLGDSLPSDTLVEYPPPTDMSLKDIPKPTLAENDSWNAVPLKDIGVLQLDSNTKDLDAEQPPSALNNIASTESKSTASNIASTESRSTASNIGQQETGPSMPVNNDIEKTDERYGNSPMEIDSDNSGETSPLRVEQPEMPPLPESKCISVSRVEIPKFGEDTYQTEVRAKFSSANWHMKSIDPTKKNYQSVDIGKFSSANWHVKTVEPPKERDKDADNVLKIQQTQEAKDSSLKKIDLPKVEDGISQKSHSLDRAPSAKDSVEKSKGRFGDERSKTSSSPSAAASHIPAEASRLLKGTSTDQPNNASIENIKRPTESAGNSAMNLEQSKNVEAPEGVLWKDQSESNTNIEQKVHAISMGDEVHTTAEDKDPLGEVNIPFKLEHSKWEDDSDQTPQAEAGEGSPSNLEPKEQLEKTSEIGKPTKDKSPSPSQLKTKRRSRSRSWSRPRKQRSRSHSRQRRSRSRSKSKQRRSRSHSPSKPRPRRSRSRSHSKSRSRRSRSRSRSFSRRSRSPSHSKQSSWQGRARNSNRRSSRSPARNYRTRMPQQHRRSRSRSRSRSRQTRISRSPNRGRRYFPPQTRGWQGRPRQFSRSRSREWGRRDYSYRQGGRSNAQRGDQSRSRPSTAKRRRRSSSSRSSRSSSSSSRSSKSSRSSSSSGRRRKKSGRTSTGKKRKGSSSDSSKSRSRSSSRSS